MAWLFQKDYLIIYLSSILT